jgi:hypothetical protein
MTQTHETTFPRILYLSHDVVPTDTGITYCWTFSVSVGNRGVLAEVDDFQPDRRKGDDAGALVDSYARVARILTMFADAAEKSSAM